MGAAILKATGLSAALAGGAFALLQAGSGMEGSLAAATPQFHRDGFGDFGESPGEDPADFGESAGFGEPAGGELYFPEADWGGDATPPADGPADPAARNDAPADFPGEDFPAVADPADRYGRDPGPDPEPGPDPFEGFAAESVGEPLPTGDAFPADDVFPTDDFSWGNEPVAADLAVETPADGFGDSDAGSDRDFGGFERDPEPAAAPAVTAPADASGFDFNDGFGDAGRGDARFERDPSPEAAPVRPVPAIARVVTPRPAEAAARLTVRKDAPATAVPGEAFVYTVTLANPGRDAVRGVAVEEAVPAGVTLEGTNPRADLAGRTLRWSFPELAAGEEVVLSVRVVPDGPGEVGGVTVVRSELSVAARTAVLAPALRLVVTPAADPRAGRPFELTYELVNDGTADAAAVAVRTVLPEGVAHASGERDLQYDVGPLPAGESRTVSLTLAAERPGEAAFACELTAANAPTSTAEARVRVGERQLTLTREGPRTRFVGRSGEYENVVTNASRDRSPAVRVIETVPEGLRFESCTAGGRYDADRRTVTWDVPGLPPGGRANVGVTLTAGSPGDAESRVSLRADGRTEATLASVTAVRGFVAVAPRVRGLNGPLAVGERVAVRMTLENTGTDPATGLVAALTLPACVKAADWMGDLRDERTPTGLRFTAAGPVPPGESVMVEVILEGLSAGSGAAELTISADHLAAPLRRSEPVQVYADGP